jgi:two-component system sensor histidine kinase AdeS
VRDLRLLMHEPFQRHGFKVEWTVQKVRVQADRTRLQQAFLALLTNARVHATPGPLTITLSREGDRAVFRVSDAGPGVPAELTERIFEPFRRGPTDARGSGLGLSVVKVTAEAHGGTARHVPNQAGGSIFEISLPA